MLAHRSAHVGAGVSPATSMPDVAAMVSEDSSLARAPGSARSTPSAPSAATSSAPALWRAQSSLRLAAAPRQVRPALRRAAPGRVHSEIGGGSCSVTAGGACAPALGTAKSAIGASSGGRSSEGAPPSGALPSGPLCKDLKGCWHSSKELRERRNAAVMKGMQWLHKVLKKNSYEWLVAIGDDAACIFFEIWYTSSSSTIRGAARGIAQDLLETYEKHLLEPASCKCKVCATNKRKGPEGKDFFMELMYLARCKEEMELDASAMLKRADSLWKRNDLVDTDLLFGVSPDDLEGVSDDEFVVLIMNIMVMEFNQLLFRKRFPLKWGLQEIFTHLRRRTYVGPPYNADFAFHHCFYFVTHIVFAISAYSAIKTRTSDVPWLYDYCRRSCLYWTKQAWRRFSKQPDRLVDIDALAEAVDVMRGCGQTDGGDTLLCSATLALLQMQRSDGSWPYWVLDECAGSGLVAHTPADPKPYSLVHPTWVAVQSLRDRNFDYDRKGNQQWGKFMEKLLRQTDLRHLETKIVYQWPTKKSSEGRRLSSPASISTAASTATSTAASTAPSTAASAVAGATAASGAASTTAIADDDVADETDEADDADEAKGIGEAWLPRGGSPPGGAVQLGTELAGDAALACGDV